LGKLGGGPKGSATALQNFGGRTANDLVAAATEPINKEGLTKAARALTKHASGQRATGTFPKLTGGIENQNSVAQKIVDEIVTDPKAVYTNLSREGLKFEFLMVGAYAITVMAPSLHSLIRNCDYETRTKSRF
ncbi:hypothetical protein ACSQRO_006136, partial [Pseudomonas aeruginosa]